MRSLLFRGVSKARALDPSAEGLEVEIEEVRSICSRLARAGAAGDAGGGTPDESGGGASSVRAAVSGAGTGSGCSCGAGAARVGTALPGGQHTGDGGGPDLGTWAFLGGRLG